MDRVTDRNKEKVRDMFREAIRDRKKTRTGSEALSSNIPQLVKSGLDTHLAFLIIIILLLSIIFPESRPVKMENSFPITFSLFSLWFQ